ncbi:MAG: hypothetical protein KBA02_00285 [Paludibacteraceae bacterium]|nr:hypothetical protein [Paludibacteraceae bacterium]
MSEAHLGVIIGLSTAILSIMFGILISAINKLDRKLEQSTNDCRIRHEHVVNSDNYVLEYNRLDTKVNNIDNRVTRLESKLEV